MRQTKKSWRGIRERIVSRSDRNQSFGHREGVDNTNGKPSNSTFIILGGFAQRGSLLKSMLLLAAVSMLRINGAYAADAQEDSGLEDQGTPFSVEMAGCSLDIAWAGMSAGSGSAKPAAPTLDDAQELPACKVQWDGQELLYICQCAASADAQSGALDFVEKGKRPQLSSICSDKFQEHCGELRPRMVRECENTQGRCKVRAVGIDGAFPSAQLSVNCQCEGERGWYYEERGSKKPDYVEAELDDICAKELAECPGNAGSGLGDGFALPMDENFSAFAGSRFEQGECRMSHGPNKTGYIECECDNRFEIRKEAGELLDQAGTDKLLDYCDGQMYECQDMLLAGKGPTGDWRVKQGKPDEDEPSGEESGGGTDNGKPGNQDKPDDAPDADDANDDNKEDEGASEGAGEPDAPLDVEEVLEILGCHTGGPGTSMFGLFFAGWP